MDQLDLESIGRFVILTIGFWRIFAMIFQLTWQELNFASAVLQQPTHEVIGDYIRHLSRDCRQLGNAAADIVVSQDQKKFPQLGEFNCVAVNFGDLHRS
jgi:hypothetical protein